MTTITLWFGVLLNRWQHATLTDYAHMVLAVVLLGWFFTRVTTR